VATRNYLFQFDATTWGWIHLLVGLLAAVAGWGLLSGQTWARVVASGWRRKANSRLGHPGRPAQTVMGTSKRPMHDGVGWSLMSRPSGAL
jgi:hypothetical protein